MISVILPVGPFKDDTKWLNEALQSINNQTVKPTQIVLVDDCAGLPAIEELPAEIPVTVHKNIWRLGCADSWNIGIALARNELCFMMAADDCLEPNCIETLLDAWHRVEDSYAYYSITIRYMHNKEVQSLPCNAAMVTKTFWRYIGGFPPEAGLGMPDALILSAMMANPHRTKIIKVREGTPLYNVRAHAGQDTARNNKYFNAIHEVRDVYSRTWAPNA